MDEEQRPASARGTLSPAQRATPLRYTIDPGFVNHRKCQSFLGPEAMQLLDAQIAALPPMADWERSVRIDHIYTQFMLLACAHLGVPTLGVLLQQEKGRIFCSTETVTPSPEVYTAQRAVSVVIPKLESTRRVELHYSTRHISSDTLRSHLRQGEMVSIIAHLRGADAETLVFEPFIMGNPWLAPEGEEPDFDIMWYTKDFFEHYVDDVDEFSRVEAEPTPDSPEPMQQISEAAFKRCIAEILGDSVQGDWGGEKSDFFSAHIHLKGHRTTAAFVFKGPARFSPMDLTHLGKKGDQIYRLSQEPAQLLVVQHCHDILPVVRDTLRAFAVQPGRPRRYMLVDGRDSLRLVRAYDLYERALELSRKQV